MMSCISDLTVQTIFSQCGSFVKWLEINDAIVSPWSGLCTSPAHSPSMSMMYVLHPLPSLPNLLRLFKGSIMPCRNALLGSEIQLWSDNKLCRSPSLQI